MNSRDKEKVMRILEQIDICLLTTFTEDNQIHSRPMAIVMNPDSDLPVVYFYIKNSSLLAKEINLRDDILINFMDQDSQIYITYSGRAEICEKENLKEILWSPFMKAWFPDGLRDRELGLIEVELNEAQIWDTPGGRIVSLSNTIPPHKTDFPPRHASF